MTGFIHISDGQLRTPDGKLLVMRGVGIGNWLLPEGYMWLFWDGPSSPRTIEKLIIDLVGSEAASRFWQTFTDQFFTERDVARIAACGYDHIRLPINSRVVMAADGSLIENGLRLIDRCIDWCRDHGLWVVLDLHGAPGGQTGTNIDDSPNNRPELFSDDRYRRQTIELWTALAHRYRDEPVVAGYDLLNEPLPDDYQHTYAEALKSLYRELTAAIRAVDPHHVIIYEGSHWATNWEIFDEVWDDNSMLQFHKYWSPPDRASIEQYLRIAQRLNLAIYMGEGGENSIEWIQACFRLYDDHQISWNFWPWKKMATISSPCSIDEPDGWQQIADFGAGRGPAPSREVAQGLLDRLLHNMILDNCTWRAEVVNAMMQRTPLRLAAYGFGYQGPGQSFGATNRRPGSDLRPDTAITLEHLNPSSANIWAPAEAERTQAGVLVVSLQPGEWVGYQVNVPEPGPLRLTIEAVDPLDAVLEVWLGEVAVTGDWAGQHWCGEVDASGGTTFVRVGVSSGVLRFNAVTLN